MAAGILTSGPASALLLLAALATCLASDDDVTLFRCKADGRGTRTPSFPKDYHATVLYTQECHITEVASGDFEDLPNLTAIELDYNDITHIDTIAFRDVPQLQKLQLAFNKLRELPIFDEQSCPSLVGLYIHNNLLTSITNGKTFAACTKLQYLTLSSNRIEYLDPKVFNPLTDLKELYLGGNKLTFIQTAFPNRKLKELSLGGNRLTHLPSDFLVTLGSLDTFYFGGNRWQCACLIELLAEVKRVGVSTYKKSPFIDIVRFDGTHPECLFIGRYPCRRDAGSGLLPTVRRK